jgi:spore germination cell wall hydrolase CwlJ-like protein
MAGAEWRIAQAVAVVAATGNWHEVAPDTTFFHARRVAPGWSGMKRVSAIGNHIFYARR